jgi:hypothetical protein
VGFRAPERSALVSRSPIAPKIRWQVFARDGYQCRYCGARPPAVALVVDHVLAVARGGTDDPDNLIAACEGCNQGKGTAPAPRIYTPEWKRLVKLVPDLQALADEIAGIKGDKGFCANRVWYGRQGYRRIFNQLVGSESHHPEPWVNTMEAHTVGYQTLYKLLPDCNHEDRWDCFRV